MAEPGKWTEEQWLREIHRPDAPQLTLRAILAGALIGAVMCLSNLYVFFKAGWSMGVTVTAGILAFALFKGLAALRLGQPLTLLENNALTTVASGAGYMTGGGNMAAWGALVMAIVAGSSQLGSEAGTAGAAAIELPATLPMILWFALVGRSASAAPSRSSASSSIARGSRSRPAPPRPRRCRRSTAAAAAVRAPPMRARCSGAPCWRRG